MCEWFEESVTHPCGHVGRFADSCRNVDDFCCPTCGLSWQVVTQADEWGRIKRVVILRPQLELVL